MILSKKKTFLGIQEVLVEEINNTDSKKYAILTTTDSFYRYKEAVKELILNNQLLAMQSYGMGMSDVSQASAWAQEQEMMDFTIPDMK